MSSKSAEPRSISFQLVVPFTLAAAMLLGCGLGVFYLMVVRHAFEEDNAFLIDKIEAVRAELGGPGGPAALEQELKAVHLNERASYLIRVLDNEEHTLAETAGFGSRLPIAAFPAPKGEDTASRITDFTTGHKLYSLVTVPTLIRGQRYLIQAAQDRSEDEEFTKEFGALLAIVLGVGVIASAWIAIQVTRRGLRPLTEMTRSLERTGPAHLHERMAPENSPRELQPLVIAFDDMLNRLEDSFTRLSQFSADLAHELRTPIGNLCGEAEVALTRPRSSEEYRAVIESSLDEYERLAGVIDSLLFLARAEAADRSVEKTLFDARAAVEKIKSYYDTVAEEQQITLSCIGEGNVYADARLFGRALSNLVENAIRHTLPNGLIEISVTANTDRTEVAVADNGCGIAAEHLPRLFDRFYRVDSSRSSQGTGLGLALVKSITDLHGGSALITSTPGSGTTVTLVFPTTLASRSAGT